MIEIDGSRGEGGGQILRTAVALSAITSLPLSIMNIRAKRKKPGLMRQHFAAIDAVRTICDAKVTGLELRSPRLTFEPDRIRPGEYRFQVGSAGSTSLVMQTILMPLLCAEGPSTVRIEGGTHNPMAPPFDFLERSYLPQLRRMGADVDLKLNRYGFYPAGGGKVLANIRPIEAWRGIDLVNRGDLLRRSIRSTVANLPTTIAQRELDHIQKKTEWPQEEFELIETNETDGPGNAVVIELEFENVTAVYTGFGQMGRRAETIAQETLRFARAYLRSQAPVCEHLADQLLLPMAIAAHHHKQASRFVTHEMSSHATTHIELINEFMDVTLRSQPRSDGCFDVCVQPAGNEK